MGSVRQFPVILRPGEDGWTIAECPVLDGCISQGRTRDEALANITEAIQTSRRSGQPRSRPSSSFRSTSEKRDELVHSQAGRSDDAAERASVELRVKGYGYGPTAAAHQAHMAAALVNNGVAQ